MTKSGKYCVKRRNYSFWAISSFVTMFSKIRLLTAEASESVYMMERVKGPIRRRNLPSSTCTWDIRSSFLDYWFIKHSSWEFASSQASDQRYLIRIDVFHETRWWLGYTCNLIRLRLSNFSLCHNVFESRLLQRRQQALFLCGKRVNIKTLKVGFRMAWVKCSIGRWFL